MIVRLKSTSSTMKDAAALAAQDAPHGTAVVAEHQTAGIGRHGHTWHSEADGGLYLSIVLRLPAAAPALTMALGLAVQQAVDELAGVAADLRWPNDVMLNSRKLAGILVQSVEGGAVIAGIGVNVNQSGFPEELKDIATSLRIETGVEHSKDTLLARIIAEALRYAAIDKAEILRRFEARSSYVRGKAVEVDGVKGVTEGLDPEGFLLLRTENGLRTIMSGGVRG